MTEADRLVYLIARALALKDYIHLTSTVNPKSSNPIVMIRFEFSERLGSNKFDIEWPHNEPAHTYVEVLDQLENEINWAYDTCMAVARRRAVADAALAKLNDEEREALGLTRK